MHVARDSVGIAESASRTYLRDGTCASAIFHYGQEVRVDRTLRNQEDARRRNYFRVSRGHNFGVHLARSASWKRELPPLLPYNNPEAAGIKRVALPLFLSFSLSLFKRTVHRARVIILIDATNELFRATAASAERRIRRVMVSFFFMLSTRCAASRS